MCFYYQNEARTETETSLSSVRRDEAFAVLYRRFPFLGFRIWEADAPYAGFAGSVLGRRRLLWLRFSPAYDSEVWRLCALRRRV
ncbi:hypothetical protein BRARA_D01914 [Brassica rapa]|uniref:Uncharacterized protein n=1 Tax=Brassica campestris TaxID=3711 RepID=A0A397ZMC0_BRACM|nr:hypothetical protein BRARA_D01914 [Brassica rapa]